MLNIKKINIILFLSVIYMSTHVYAQKTSFQAKCFCSYIYEGEMKVTGKSIIPERTIKIEHKANDIEFSKLEDSMFIAMIEYKEDCAHVYDRKHFHQLNESENWVTLASCNSVFERISD